MKIAVFHNIIAPGGAKRTLFEEVKYLSRKHELHLYSLTTADSLAWDINSYVKKSYIYNYNNTITAKGIIPRLIKDYKDLFTLKKLHKKIAEDINKRDYDVILTHLDSFTESPYIIRFLKKKSLYFSQSYLRIGWDDYVSPVSDLLFHQKVYEKIMRYIRKRIDITNARFATKVYTSSNFMKERLDEKYKIKSLTNYLGINPNKFKTHVLPKKQSILFAGDKNRIKGYDTALAMREIVKKYYPGFSLDDLKTSGGLKINNDILLSKKYAQSFITLCMGREEPFGLSVVESMASGTPVIAVNEGGYKEIIINNKTGYLVERDEKIIADKIIKLYKNKIKYKKMCEAGAKLVPHKFTWEMHCQKIEKGLEELI